MRKDLIPYFGLPFYRAMIERSGFGEDIAAYDAAAGDLEAMQAAISDEFLEQLTAVGDAAAVQAGHRALPRRGGDLAVHRPDPGDRFPRDAQGRGALTRSRRRAEPAGAGAGACNALQSTRDCQRCSS